MTAAAVRWLQEEGAWGRVCLETAPALPGPECSSAGAALAEWPASATVRKSWCKST